MHLILKWQLINFFKINCCERSEQHPILYRGQNLDFSKLLMSLTFVLIASLLSCWTTQHALQRAWQCASSHDQAILFCCDFVVHFCRVGNFTFFLVNITLYCFVTVSLKELFGLYFQSIVDFKSYERNDIKGPTNRSVAWKLANKPNWANVLTARWPMCRTTHCGRKHQGHQTASFDKYLFGKG